VCALGFAVAGGCLVYATADELMRLTRVVTPTPPEVAQDLIVRNVEDKMGRSASFRVLLFSDEFRWRLSSFESLEQKQNEPEFTAEMKTVLNSAQEIICVGASSEEIPRGMPYEQGRALEETRAGRRADQIAHWVRKVLSRPVPIRKLNVGHHTATRGAADTSDQRRVVIILVLDHEDGADLDQALRAAMARESIRAPIFEALLTRYSLSTAKAFTWVR
jgi:hypothetical protein